MPYVCKTNLTKFFDFLIHEYKKKCPILFLQLKIQNIRDFPVLLNRFFEFYELQKHFSKSVPNIYKYNKLSEVEELVPKDCF